MLARLTSWSTSGESLTSSLGPCTAQATLALGGIRWFYDGELYNDLSREAVGNREWVFDQPFFIILNLALGGTLGGTISLDTEFPTNLYVDYVRVYQQES
jgi:hypothetical protein